MIEEPTNRELYIILTGLKTSFDEWKDYQLKMNEKVKKNTDFRNKIIGGMTVVSFIGIANLFGLVLIYLQFLKI